MRLRLIVLSWLGLILPLVAAPVAIHVDDLRQQRKETLSGEIRVVGVVSRVSAEDRLLGLIDAREYVRCSRADCALFTLPVQWNGPMPEVKARVLVTGSVQRKDGKLIFMARSMEWIQP
jgi:hypothetical protein